MSKSGYIIFVLILAFSACTERSGKDDGGAGSAGKGNHMLQTGPAAADRKKLIIAGLKQMQEAFSDKDISQIEKYFNFPLAESTLSIYDLNEDFDQARKANGNKISRELFIRNFNDIYDYFQLGSFNDLFKAVKLDDLKHKNELSSENHTEDEGCYYLYRIKVEGDTVKLQYGTNSDQAFRAAHPDEEEICNEASFEWTFKLEGTQLRLVSELTAG